MRDVLLTGGLGFIGRNVLSQLLTEAVNVHVVVRPNTPLPEHMKTDRIRPVFLDLEHLEDIEERIGRRHFDTVFHIGAIRGGRPVGRDIYKRVNVDATECLAKIALKKSAKFIFCSSVGVFGAIPKQLPPAEDTERQRDNYYHATKILAEERLRALQKEGLQYVVLRPSITYGKDDFGFPYSLIHMVNTGIFVNCTAPVEIAMVDMRTLTQAFINAAILPVKNGSAYNICDRTPVLLKDLVNFIAQQLFHRKYSNIKILPSVMFRCAEFVFGHILKNELWKARFQLISKSWYYDPLPAMQALAIHPQETIPNFQYVIDWYKEYSAKGQ